MVNSVSPVFSYLNEKLNTRLDKNVDSLKSAAFTLEEVIKIIKNPSWKNVEELINAINTKGSLLSRRSELHTASLNVTLRVLKIIREEALKVLNGPQADFEENLTNRLFAVEEIKYSQVSREAVLGSILVAIDEFKSDLKSGDKFISTLASNLIHSDELILTVGYSKSALKFFENAKSIRNFKVVIAECSPEYSGHKMAHEISKLGIYTILVPDSHIFALMSRINKLIVSCDAVYPDGTIRAVTGTQAAMLSAKKFLVPTYVCLPSHKLSPISKHAYLTKFDVESFEKIKLSIATNPEKPNNISTHKKGKKSCSNKTINKEEKSIPVLSTVPKKFQSSVLETSPEFYYPEYKILPADLINNTNLVKVWPPKFEYIPPGLINLFLTSTGAHAPSYLYALIREFFHPIDVSNALNWI